MVEGGGHGHDSGLGQAQPSSAGMLPYAPSPSEPVGRQQHSPGRVASFGSASMLAGWAWRSLSPSMQQLTRRFYCEACGSPDSEVRCDRPGEQPLELVPEREVALGIPGGQATSCPLMPPRSRPPAEKGRCPHRAKDRVRPCQAEEEEEEARALVTRLWCWHSTGHT